MPLIDNVEFRKLCAAVQWNSGLFARAANIKPRNARQMWDDLRPVPEPLMSWLRGIAHAAEQVPEPPEREIR